MHSWYDVSPGIDVGAALPRHFKAIIEITKNCNNKYELDKGMRMLKLDRVLSSAVF